MDIFSLPDGCFLDDMISELTSTKSENKNNKHFKDYYITKS
jgi:hypothetical protein